MPNFPNKLDQKLDTRNTEGLLRELFSTENLIDFSSNDYLGMAKSKEVLEKAYDILKKENFEFNGATGSRLLSGHSSLIEDLEDFLASFHEVEAGLLFNSGYDANVGFFSSVPQRNDVVFYDELIHASIRDGIQMGLAKSYKFGHNDLHDLKRKVSRLSLTGSVEVYVVTESLFSMNGDRPDLVEFADFCKSNGFHLVVDEAHATGIYGAGKGLINQLGLENEIFARVITFGKALGCHGAAILGSQKLKDYLVNFSRSFIYTTALPPHSIATIKASFEHLKQFGNKKCEALFENIAYFENKVTELSLQDFFMAFGSAIQCAIIPGNEKIKRIAEKLAESGFDVRAVRSPTVPNGKERLRFCIHSFNSKQEISQVLTVLKSSINS